MTNRSIIVSIIALAMLASASPVFAQRFQPLRDARPFSARVGVEKPVTNPTAELALTWLTEGNARFQSQQRRSPNAGLSRVSETAKNGQHPFVTILSCSDSRVPLEVIFDRGIGDIFVIRVAGNIAGESEIGSIEYGVEHVGTPLLVVLGHTKCGAVTATATNAQPGGSITKVLEKIQPAVAKVKNANPEIKDETLIKKATVENVWESVKALMTRSEILRNRVKEKKLHVVGAIYHVESGEVEWLGEHADMKQWVGN